MLHRAARNAYSWWWASHIRTKQSKWLDQNLQDMEEKVEYILKIIDEDADTFAQRAEMYYRKRLELMNFVEDSFRGYRALSERYDHLSRELQSANRTIATIYPERVHLEMDDDDNISGEVNFHPKASESRTGSKGTVPAAPNLTIEKLTSFGKKSSKLPSRLMSKKGLIKINEDCAAPTPSSGLSKVEALEEIDKLQKEILGLQTEREFVKSSYECGLAKYWDIENQVTEKQAKVNSLQDEFGVGTVIEDDEARTLMTNRALKSCQEALARLHEKQQESNQMAREEHLKIQEARARIETFRERLYRNELLGKETSKNSENNNLEVLEVVPMDLDFLRKKIKENLGFDSEVPLSMPELADKVDELVEKIINLETALCSQTAKVKGLMSETNELQSHLQSLEKDKESLPEELSHKIRELEKELSGVQRLDQCVQTLNNDLHSNFLEASYHIDELSEKLSNVKPYCEEVNINEEDISFDSWYAGYSGKNGQSQTAVSAVIEDKEKNGISIKDEEMKDDVVVKEREKNDDVLNGDVPVKEREKNDDVLNVDVPVKEREKSDDVQNHISSDSLMDDILNKDSKNSLLDNSINECKEKEDKAPSDSEASFFIHTNPMFSSVGKKTMAPIDNHVGEDINTIDEQQKNEVSDNLSITSNDMEMKIEQKKNVLLNQGEKRKIENQDSFKTANSNQDSFKTANSNQDSFKTANSDFSLEQEKLSTEYDEEPNWKELCLSGLDDKEKILLQEYTKVLRNYKDVKKKLNEVEKKRRASLFQTAVQIKVLTRANSSKSAEIQSLQDKLNKQVLEPRGIREDSTSPEQSIIAEEEKEDDKISIYVDEKISIHLDEPPPFSTLEGKIRMEIDDLLEENIEFWLRFSTSFHQIQKFQTSVEDLQAEVAKVKEKKQELPATKDHMINSEIRPIYRHLREIQTELTLLLEHNGVLKDDLNNRLSSLSNLHEEITRLSKNELSEYQAAKFQGEIMNMKQENGKVANELQLGFGRVKELQCEIQKTLAELDEELGISGNNQQHRSRSRIPLRSFLFGVKLKKQKPSLFACINPALQKQYSDLTASQT
ncbi:hypothetical protein RD792_011138 [Penstemon davidsonii]|uniref:NAB domain-containing protein n=1 Tax=Penstemon davidsonii TaxID=160366 RepID=A0ABR0D4I4_9LAMI|nr:hypothetical protein RD792_011138 [Penstemon davidsonii]